MYIKTVLNFFQKIESLGCLDFNITENGNLFSFNVSSGTNTSIIIGGLAPYTQYKVSVFASTSRNFGKPAEIIYTTSSIGESSKIKTFLINLFLIKFCALKNLTGNF